MTVRALRPGLHWLRDDRQVQVVIADDQPALCLSGADAQLWELWVGGGTPATVITEVALCWCLPEAEVWRRFSELIRRLAASGAVVNQQDQVATDQEGQWPTCS